MDGFRDNDQHRNTTGDGWTDRELNGQHKITLHRWTDGGSNDQDKNT